MLQPLRETLEERLDAWEQRHVLDFWDRLDELSQRRLAHQLMALDLAGVRQAVAPRPPASQEPWDLPRIERHPEHGGDPDAFAEARAAGEAELAEGRVAILLVAGGQGTRLGHGGPKGTFPIGPVTTRSLFEVFAQQIRALGRRYGHAPPWLLMTSPENDLATRRFFEEHDHFGIPPEDIYFFCQAEAPCTSADGKLLMAAPDRLLTSPDGHGGVVAGLARERLHADLAERGINQLFFHQVDNPLLPVGDPHLVGFRVRSGAQVASKVVAKRHPEDRVGSWVQRGDQVHVIEYTELGEPERSRRGDGGELELWAGSINVYVFDRRWLEALGGNQPEALPYHASPKPLRALGPDERMHDLSGFKLERFIFDALPHANACVLVEARRASEYAPVKNAVGGESIQTARQALSARDHGWLQAAGVQADETAALELDLSVFDGPDALHSSGLGSVEERSDAIFTAYDAQVGGQP